MMQTCMYYICKGSGKFIFTFWYLLFLLLQGMLYPCVVDTIKALPLKASLISFRWRVNLCRLSKSQGVRIMLVRALYHIVPANQNHWAVATFNRTTPCGSAKPSSNTLTESVAGLSWESQLKVERSYWFHKSAVHSTLQWLCQVDEHQCSSDGKLLGMFGFRHTTRVFAR